TCSLIRPHFPGHSSSLCFSDCQQWSPGSNEIQRVLAHSLDAQCNCGVSAVYFKDPTETCQGTEFRLTTLLTAKSAGQLSSLLQAFASFLESARTVPVATWNGTVEKACSKGTGVTNLPPGASTEKPGATPDPTSHHELLISEVNPDNPGGHEDNEYVELFYTGRVLFDLHDYWLVLYNGKNNQAYRVVNLTGHTTDEQGYFLLGSAGVSPKPMIVLPPNTIQNGGDGVALYHSSTHTYKAGMVVTEEGLVDAIVSTARESEKADKLLMVLTPGQSILYEDDSHSSQDESLSRCHGLKPRNQSSFQVRGRSLESARRPREVGHSLGSF
uniref:LTD domain-containing protein n=1 Tax=Sphenodon punctatus TaxID=8508 RepID=A0A8D0HCF4_SPHPU